MSSMGDEYKTEFGEFVDFTADLRETEAVKEPFQDFTSLQDIDFKQFEQTPFYTEIKNIVERIKVEKKQ